ncbi:hypothetical protein BJX99DRAFT_18278 [Aspergillus californicus]
MRFTFVIGLVALFPLAFASTSSTSTSASTTNSTESAVCYNLDGSEAHDDVPCGSGDVVNCCNSGDICMSNGLCYQQGDRGMVLSRGSCTDDTWGPKCYAPCSDYEREGGVTIVNLGFDSDEPEYCCGAVSIDDDELSCAEGDSFTIPHGTAVLGVAGLSNNSTDEDHDDDDDDSHADEDEDDEDHKDHEVSPALAIALGVGIPLGLILMAGVLWAVWERRRRQLRIQEEEENAGNGTVMAGMPLPGLHYRYGPIPSPAPTHSRRGTPTQSGVFIPVPMSPPQEPVVEPMHGHQRMVSDSVLSDGSFDERRRT